MAKKGETKKNAKEASKKKRAFNATEKQKKFRAARNKARRKAVREGRAKKGDGKDIGHIKALSQGGSRSTKNTRVQNRNKNRSSGGRIGGKRSK